MARKINFDPPAADAPTQLGAFSGKVESGGIPNEARIRFKIPTGTRGPVMNGEAILRRPA